MSRVKVRNLWFQVHKWIGLILCVVLIPLSLTGSLLVWHDGLDEMLHGQRFPASGEATQPVSRYVAAVAPLLPPGGRVTGIALPENGRGAVVVRMAPPAPPEGAARGGRPRSLSVWVDPRSMAVLDSAWSDQGVIRVLHIFHGTLMIPGVGRAIVGWLGVLMLISSISGLWIWWPTIGRWVRGLRWRRGNKFDLNLHHSVGFWIALPLAVLSLTGAWISFPAFFSGLVGEPAMRRPPGFGGGGRVPQPRLTPDEAVSLFAARGKVTEIGMPSAEPAKWSGTVADESGRALRLQIDDATAEVSTAVQPPRGPVMGLMRKLHDGVGTGIVWQTIIFLGGIAPAALGITGVTMWLRSRRWRGQAEARAREKANART
ncbi:MAG: PepSY protein [Sphingomonas bacterium]|nr:PepSY-associated TM helix domain-containing protein [Sphingomonas bacterium]MDB5688548.1 PepSY protein [Sphingomonas bacterium]